MRVGRLTYAHIENWIDQRRKKAASVKSSQTRCAPEFSFLALAKVGPSLDTETLPLVKGEIIENKANVS